MSKPPAAAAADPPAWSIPRHMPPLPGNPGGHCLQWAGDVPQWVFAFVGLGTKTGAAEAAWREWFEPLLEPLRGKLRESEAFQRRAQLEAEQAACRKRANQAAAKVLKAKADRQAEELAGEPKGMAERLQRIDADLATLAEHEKRAAADVALLSKPLADAEHAVGLVIARLIVWEWEPLKEKVLAEGAAVQEELRRLVSPLLTRLTLLQAAGTYIGEHPATAQKIGAALNETLPEPGEAQ